eukprot:gene11483-biopygen3276
MERCLDANERHVRTDAAQTPPAGLRLGSCDPFPPPLVAEKLTPTASPACADVGVMGGSGLLACNQVTQYCNENSANGDLVKEGCPHTCGTCGLCWDRYNTGMNCGSVACTCPQLSGMCNDPTLGARTMSKCPLTCGQCTTATPTSCADLGVTSGGNTFTCQQVAQYCNQRSANGDLVTGRCPVPLPPFKVTPLSY